MLHACWSSVLGWPQRRVDRGHEAAARQWPLARVRPRPASRVGAGLQATGDLDAATRHFEHAVASAADPSALATAELNLSMVQVSGRTLGHACGHQRASLDPLRAAGVGLPDRGKEDPQRRFGIRRIAEREAPRNLADDTGTTTDDSGSSSTTDTEPVNRLVNPSLEAWADADVVNTYPDGWTECDGGALGLEAVPDVCADALPTMAADGARVRPVAAHTRYARARCRPTKRPSSALEVTMPCR